MKVLDAVSIVSAFADGFMFSREGHESKKEEVVQSLNVCRVCVLMFGHSIFHISEVLPYGHCDSFCHAVCCVGSYEQVCNTVRTDYVK